MVDGGLPSDAAFDDIVSDLVLGSAEASAAPTLRVVLSESGNGRSRATGRAHGGGPVINARDLEILAHRLLGEGEDPRKTAAAWLQRLLTAARERRISVTLEGAFRSPGLVVGLSRLFAGAGYSTEVWTMVFRPVEARIADASRRFDTHLRRTDVPHASLDTAPTDIATTLNAVTQAEAIDRVVILDRDGTTVLDAAKGEADFDTASDAFHESAGRPLGTMRSTLLLTELRRMTHLLSEIRSTPGWAVDDLVELHELALTDLIPELPIPAESDAARIQEERMRATLTVLRNLRTPETPDSGTSGPVVAPQPDGPGISR